VPRRLDLDFLLLLDVRLLDDEHELVLLETEIRRVEAEICLFFKTFLAFILLFSIRIFSLAALR
jgi:hypothetical protein